MSENVLTDDLIKAVVDSSRSMTSCVDTDRRDCCGYDEGMLVGLLLARDRLASSTTEATDITHP